MQVLEGTAASVRCRLDAQADFAGVFVDVVALCGVLVRHSSLAGFDGHLSVVAQGHNQVVGQGLVDLHGERRFNVFSYRSLVGSDGDQYLVALVTGARGTRAWLVGDSSTDRRPIQSELFKLANICAGNGSDRFDDRIVSADIVVVRRGHSDRTGGAVGWDGDDSLAIVQGEGQRAVFVDWQAIFVGQGHGVGDLTTFGNRVGSSQFRDNFVDGVGDFHRRLVTQLQVFEGTTTRVRCRLDAQADFTGVFVDVIALSSVLVRHSSLAGFDGHLSVVAQGHDQVVGQGFVDLHGERWFDVLGYRSLIRGNGNQHLIALVTSARGTRTWLVGDSSADRRFIQSELFELADVRTSNAGDRFNDRIVSADIVVVRRRNGYRTGSAVSRDGDDSLAIVQGKGQRAMLVDWQAVFVGQGHGVSDLTAFGDRVGRGELGYNFIDGIGDFDRCIVAQLQVLERTTTRVGCRLDAQADFTGVFVDVVALGGVLIRNSSLASFDGDLSVVAQGHDQVVGQGLVDLHGERRFNVFSYRSLVSSDGDQHLVALVTSAWRARTWLVGHLGADRCLIER